MLNKKQKKSLITTVIGEDTSIKGEINSSHSIRIEGNFEGKISIKGDVFIGYNSKVKADILGNSIEVTGEVIGNMEALKSVVINKTGKVYGDIKGDRLVVHEGGIYRGKVLMDVLSSENRYEGQEEFKINS